MPRSYREMALQKQCVEYLHLAVAKPPYGPFWTAVNPLPGTSARQGKIAKDMGMRAGVPDLIFIWKGRVTGIELKTDRGGLSDNQSVVHEEMFEVGARTYTVKSLDAFIETVNEIISEAA